MADRFMNLKKTEQASIALSSLGDEDRRLVHAWFDHLRNWWNDDFIRSRSQRLPADEEVYILPTSTDLRIAFSIAGDDITILSIFRKDALRPFEKMVRQGNP